MTRTEFVEFMDEAIGRLWDGVEVYTNKEEFSCLCVYRWCRDRLLDLKTMDRKKTIQESYENIFAPIDNNKECWWGMDPGFYSMDKPDQQALRHFHLLSFKEFVLANELYNEW